MSHAAPSPFPPAFRKPRSRAIVVILWLLLASTVAIVAVAWFGTGSSRGARTARISDLVPMPTEQG